MFPSAIIFKRSKFSYISISFFFIFDSHNFLSKVAPEAFKNIAIVQGDGGIGSIQITNFGDASGSKYSKHRIDALDKDKFSCEYTIFEGDMMAGILESIAYDYKFEASDNGGSICKVALDYHTKGGDQVIVEDCGPHGIKQEDLKDAEEKAMGLYKIAEAYLLANPHVYA